MLLCCFVKTYFPFYFKFSHVGIWTALFLTEQCKDFLQSRQDCGWRESRKEREGRLVKGTIVHRSVTVDNCVPSSCQISSLLNLLENHIDLERNLLLTPTWIPCGVEKGLLYSLSPCSGLSNKLKSCFLLLTAQACIRREGGWLTAAANSWAAETPKVTVLVEVWNPWVRVSW